MAEKNSMEYYSYKMLIVLETLLMLGLELAKKT